MPGYIAWEKELMVVPVIAFVEYVFHSMCNIAIPLLYLKAKVYLLFCVLM